MVHAVVLNKFPKLFRWKVVICMSFMIVYLKICQCYMECLTKRSVLDAFKIV